jgi:hypothetical protein
VQDKKSSWHVSGERAQHVDTNTSMIKVIDERSARS